MSNWIERAEAALTGRPGDGVEVLHGQSPPVFDREGSRAAIAPLMAAFLWAAAVFREGVAAQPLDPAALLLRLLALAFTARTCLAGVRLLRRLTVWANHRRYMLALADDGLLLRTPEGDFAVPREHVLAVAEHGQSDDRAGRRWADVFVVTRPDAGRIVLALPPVFLDTPGMLAERLMRWRGAAVRRDAGGEEATAAREGTPRAHGALETETHEDATQTHGGAETSSREDADEVHGAGRAGGATLPSKLWEELAAGGRPPGVAVVPHGAGWLRRGPYATMLLGVAVLDGYLRLPAASRAAIGGAAPLVIALCLAIAPLAWLFLMRREIKAQHGIALALTPGELLTRTRAGTQRIPWSHVARLEITSRNVWSLLHGAEPARTLVVHRKSEDPLAFSEAFLGVPAEVAVALGEAYRKGAR